jgi:hypothetical protein
MTTPWHELAERLQRGLPLTADHRRELSRFASGISQRNEAIRDYFRDRGLPMTNAASGSFCWRSPAIARALSGTIVTAPRPVDPHLGAFFNDCHAPSNPLRSPSPMSRQSLPSGGRLILMIGTPHQGSATRLKNLLRLISEDSIRVESAAGRVIYRTKDRIRNWRDGPLRRQVVAMGIGPADDRRNRNYSRIAL